MDKREEVARAICYATECVDAVLMRAPACADACKGKAEWVLADYGAAADAVLELVEEGGDEG